MTFDDALAREVAEESAKRCYPDVAQAAIASGIDFRVLRTAVEKTLFV